MLTAPQIETVLGDRPRVIASLDATHREAGVAVDPRHLALCQGRVSQLLGVATDEVTAMTDFEHALIAFVEQWVIDVASITDGLVAPLRESLGDDGLQDLIHGLLVVEQRVRLGLVWKQLGLLP